MRITFDPAKNAHNIEERESPFELMAQLRHGRGRPPKEDRKVNQTARIDPEVLEAYRQAAKGWQTHINEVLRQHMPPLK
jgi:uncharacterized protein (DUF4415 family)